MIYYIIFNLLEINGKNASIFFDTVVLVKLERLYSLLLSDVICLVVIFGVIGT